jgi:Mn-dependent DtxR family transcriptional regulator
MKAFSEKQGQYLAFIYWSSKVNGRPPSEAEMERFFKVSPPSIHDMVLRLEAGGFIERTPGKGRSIRLLVPLAELPVLK